jgi:hypothetical protein
VASIMEKYTLADPWSAKNEKVCCNTRLVTAADVVTDSDGSVSLFACKARQGYPHTDDCELQQVASGP